MKEGDRFTGGGTVAIAEEEERGIRITILRLELSIQTVEEECKVDGAATGQERRQLYPSTILGQPQLSQVSYVQL